jgi:toxin ParE1/3/4
MAHRLATQVVSELDEIWYYIARESDSMDIADRFVKFITDRFLLIADHPYVGRVRDDLRAGLRSFPVGQYLVLYRVVGEDVLILHVTHGRRNLEVLFGQ